MKKHPTESGNYAKVSRDKFGFQFDRGKELRSKRILVVGGLEDYHLGF